MDGSSLRQRLPVWIEQMRKVASTRPETGACAVGTAMELWAWTFDKMRAAEDCNASLAEALGWLLSARAFVLEVSDDELLVTLCHAQVARSCGEVGRICAELVFGSLRHPSWSKDSESCYHAVDLDMIEQYMPGISSCARAYSDVIEQDGSHPAKAGPCVRFEGLEDFMQLRSRLDGCLAGGFVARRNVARALSRQ